MCVVGLCAVSLINACVSSQCITVSRTGYASIVHDYDVQEWVKTKEVSPAMSIKPLSYIPSAELKRQVYSYSGLIHYHTTYSDGGGSYDETIAVAESLGVDFVVPCDHNTVEPIRDGWSRRIGNVLVIPGVEHSMSKGRGHFLSIGKNAPPVRSADFPADSVYAVCARRNDVLIVAHPFHPAHHDWEMWDDDRFTGIELYNMDENWRSNISWSRFDRLFSALFINLFRSHALNHLLVYPEKNLNAFDGIAQERHIAGIGVTDAHSRIKSSGDHILRYPRYEDMFSLVQTFVLSTEPIDGDYDHDRDIIIDALRRGRSYIGFTGLQDTRGFLCSVSDGFFNALPGDSLLIKDYAELTIHLPKSHNTVVRIIRNGNIFAEYRNRMETTHLIEQPGVYRVEVYQCRPVLPFLSYRLYPWILSNPVYVHDSMGKTNDYDRSFLAYNKDSLE